MAFTTVLSDIPEKFAAGDSLSWKKSLGDYLASDGWVLTYALVNSSALIEITGTASGDDHLIELSAATTAAYTAGEYKYQAYATSAALSERYKVDEGTVTIRPNFATQSTGYDDRTHVKKVLDALEAVILGKASKDQLSYSIAGRSISRLSPSEILEFYNEYRERYAREQRIERRRRGKATGGQIKARF